VIDIEDRLSALCTELPEDPDAEQRLRAFVLDLSVRPTHRALTRPRVAATLTAAAVIAIIGLVFGATHWTSNTAPPRPVAPGQSTPTPSPRHGPVPLSEVPSDVKAAIHDYLSLANVDGVPHPTHLVYVKSTRAAAEHVLDGAVSSDGTPPGTRVVVIAAQGEFTNRIGGRPPQHNGAPTPSRDGRFRWFAVVIRIDLPTQQIASGDGLSSTYGDPTPIDLHQLGPVVHVSLPAPQSASPGPSTDPTLPGDVHHLLPYQGTCRSAHIHARVARVGSQASAPFLVIQLTNTANSSCTMNGYVNVTAYDTTSAQPLPLAISRGTYEVPDPGPSLVVLKAHRGSAYFVLGTETANGGGANAVRITRLELGLGSHQSAISLALPANEQIGTTPNQDQQYVAGLTALFANPPTGLQPTH
jgi:Protein of unknown function (DUF4232)